MLIRSYKHPSIIIFPKPHSVISTSSRYCGELEYISKFGIGSFTSPCVSGFPNVSREIFIHTKIT